MKKNIEIRWHGRGGSGCQNRSTSACGRCFQHRYARPGISGVWSGTYGRTNHGLQSNWRIRNPGTFNIYHPDYVVVVDETLLHSVDVTNGLKEDGAIVINTPRPKEEILPLLNGYKGSVYTIDAHKVSMETLGKYFPNSPMLAAIVKVADIMDKDVFLSQMQASYEHKFAKKPEVIDGNMRALKMAFEEQK